MRLISNCIINHLYKGFGVTDVEDITNVTK